MSNRDGNSLQTAARWGRNVLVGAGVLYFLLKLATACVGVWYNLFPGIRRHMEKKYGREEAYIRFISQGVGWLLASPIVAFLVLAIVALLDDQLQLGFASCWQKFLAEANGGEIFFWIVFLLALPFVVAAVVMMSAGIVASIRPGNERPNEKVPVSRFTLYLCFYLLAIPTAAVMYLADPDYGALALTAMVLATVYFVVRWAIRTNKNPASSQATPKPIHDETHTPKNQEAQSARTEKRKRRGASLKTALPRNTIFGYVEQITSDCGHGHTLPRNNDPVREWMASMWESKLKDELARNGVLVELPRLSSEASASRCRKILSQHGVPDLSEFLDKILEIRTAYSAEDVVMHMSGFLNRHGTAVVVCVVGGEVSVFTKELSTKFPDGFLNKCRGMIHIQPEAPVGWYRAMDAQPLETTAAVALYGQSPQQSEFPKFTGSKLQMLRQRFLSSDRPAAPSAQEACYQI